MYDENIKKIIDEITSTDLLTCQKIPNIDLYMDQITTLFDDNLNSYKRNKDDKILTKTMINNYVKDGIISAPVKKKYSKNHILTLILIYHLKSILSINDINKLFSSLEDQNIENLYNDFLNIVNIENENLLNNFLNSLKQSYNDSSSNNKNQYILIVLILINQANVRKRIAEKIIDNFF